MALRFFNVVSLESQSSIRIASWNINGVCDKLIQPSVLSVLLQYDVVFLNETKTDVEIRVPGFVSHQSIMSGATNRGGVCLLLKHHLKSSVLSIDTASIDQVWLRLSVIPDIVLGSCYVPPRDSPFFSLEMLADVQARIRTTPWKYIITGDINCRFGPMLGSLDSSVAGVEITRLTSDDKVTVPNANARDVIELCRACNLIPVNNAVINGMPMQGSLTFRQKQHWVSELDWCLASQTVLSSISEFRVVQNLALPSNHAIVSFVVVDGPETQLTCVLERAQELFSHESGMPSTFGGCRRSLKVSGRQMGDLHTRLLGTPPPDFDGDIESWATSITNTLYEQGSSLPAVAYLQSQDDDSHLDRWTRLLADHDCRTIWKAIDWKGNLTSNSGLHMPSDDSFKEYMEGLLKPAGEARIDLTQYRTDVSMPVLDNPISPQEVQEAVDHLKPDKSGGPDGIAPRIYKAMPVSWITALASLFNFVFFMQIFPSEWCLSKLCMLFKKGDSRDCGNYRGISVCNIITKLYDSILCKRLQLWFCPLREQAGAQKERGCQEQFVTLRLLINYALFKKLKLFVVFVDFTKAYDTVPRDKLMRVLRSIGCSLLMITAIATLYYCTKSILGTAIITATVGVRQGSPTSCILFIIYLNEFVKRLREQSPPDGFLQWLHCLLLMDDTVLLATSRDICVRKFRVMVDFCSEYGMTINPRKSSFMVVNGAHVDKLPLTVGNCSIEHCVRYTYLGSVFTEVATLRSIMEQHVKDKYCHLLKLFSFCKRQQSMPVHMKIKVLDACLMSSVLYGCESWFGLNLVKLEKMYMSAIKCVLGVRTATPNYLCLIEAGLPSIQALIQTRQHSFFQKEIARREYIPDDPLMFALKLNREVNSPAWKYISGVLAVGTNAVDQDMIDRKEKIRNTNSTRMGTYLSLNPNLSCHRVYKAAPPFATVPEWQRIAFTRFRLSSHRLRIETGRWSRIPREQRLCDCGANEPQDEKHVLLSCTRTQTVRQKYSTVFTTPLVSDLMENEGVCECIYETLKCFE